jgi:hypothetical protein
MSRRDGTVNEMLVLKFSLGVDRWSFPDRDTLFRSYDAWHRVRVSPSRLPVKKLDGTRRVAEGFPFPFLLTKIAAD